MQPGGQAVLGKRCLYLKKVTAVEGITWLDSNKKEHTQRGSRFILLTILSYTVALSNFF